MYSSRFTGAKAAAVRLSGYLPHADSNSETYCVDGNHILTLIVVGAPH